MTGRLQDRIALITGASRGIGRAVALAFAREGAHIIAVARTTGGLEELDDDINLAGGSATLVPLDLSDYAGIDRLGGTIYERWKKLDILVGNAGILGPISPLGHISPKQWDEVMTINVTANWRLIRSMDPLLRQSDAGRAIFLTSGAAFKCSAYWGPYSVSKAAVNALVATYANEIGKTNVLVNALSPGPIRTKMRAEAMPGEDPNSLPPPDALDEAFIKLAEPGLTANGMMSDFETGQMVSLTS
ncbi:MAG: SDR family NAD(P)-dependent oxidoreductase [Rhizobiales bacterium]|nr:SDR family NAD(P)-dependent oxidoreductase [Hyphomicrobiales bacterium]